MGKFVNGRVPKKPISERSQLRSLVQRIRRLAEPPLWPDLDPKPLTREEREELDRLANLLGRLI